LITQAPILYAADCDPQLILERTVAIIGYGSQGSAHAQNLRDSGVRVIVGARNLQSASARGAAEAGFEVLPLAQAAREADLVMLLTPDEAHAATYEALAAEVDLRGKALAFAHGFAVHFGQIIPPAGVDVIMIAPKGVGPAVRQMYERGSGVAGLIAVAQDATGLARDLALSYAWAMGHGRVGIIETTFGEECETDLFSEQAIIVGGLVELLLAGYHTLVDAGYKPESAYFECVHEAKLICDQIYERGFAGMFAKISNTAEYGAQVAGKRIIDEHVRAEMRRVLAEIQDATFAHRWEAEARADMPNLLARRAEYASDPVEEVGGRLRALFADAGGNAGSGADAGTDAHAHAGSDADVSASAHTGANQKEGANG